MKNKKGFTLVELLAVIVVLALIMVIALPSILNSSASAQKKTFKLEGQKMLNNAETLVNEKLVEGTKPSDIAQCYTMSDLGIKAAGGYEGSVKVTYSSEKYTYTLYLTNGTYNYGGVDSAGVYGNEVPEILGGKRKDGTTISKLDYPGNCGNAPSNQGAGS